MKRRYVSIWFKNLSIDWFIRQQPELAGQPFVLRTSVRGRMIVTGANDVASKGGISKSMVLADARAIVPGLKVLDDKPDLPIRLLNKLGEWCIRFTPAVALDPPDGLLFDATGCSHLWGGDQKYLDDITGKISSRGYNIRASIADTIGAAWAAARYSKDLIIAEGNHIDAILQLPPECLRIEPAVSDRLHRLGLHRVSQFISMARPTLRKRFGQPFLLRIDQAIGREMESFNPVHPIEPYQERLPCMEPIVTATGIEIALEQVLTSLCKRLHDEQKGLRKAVFKCYRVDGKVVQIAIATGRPSCNVKHLFKLFSPKISNIEPDLGIELFVMEAPVVEDHIPQQEKFWDSAGGLEDVRLAELIDRIAGRVGADSIYRYLPDEHYWPERSFRKATSLVEKPSTQWPTGKLRPLQILPSPEPIEVTAPIPDYPPMLFIYKNKRHNILRADGPERIEQEWWIQQGQHRDYYRVEDEEGNRYWIFRSGHYNDKTFKWFIHGFFA